MTVKELIENLKKMPQEAKVTNEYGYVLEEVCMEPKELESGDWVWFEFSHFETD